MFAVFLPALNFRGNRSPYLWWLYKFLGEFGDQAAFIAGEEYFLDIDQQSAQGRSEANLEATRSGLYQLPDRSTLDGCLRADIPDSIWLALEALFPNNPIAAFQHYCLEIDSGLRSAIEQALDQLTAQGVHAEAVITCVNCASLQQVCERRGLPLMHLELGPLRQPHFLQTAYCDFSGVNGRTEAQRRFSAAEHDMPLSSDWSNLPQLRALFLNRSIDVTTPYRVELGLGLQVEDDSNAICYSNGHSSQSLISAARRQMSCQEISAPVLVRTHPGSPFGLQSPPIGLEPDQSASSLDFILQCRRVATVNSGIAVEAALLGRSVQIQGESPFAFCLEPQGSVRSDGSISFFLLNYLVPWQLAFRPEYLRWRMTHPPELEIRRRHLEHFMQDKIRILEVRIAEMESTLAERDAQLARIKTSLVWRLGASLARFYRSVRQALSLRRG